MKKFTILLIGLLAGVAQIYQASPVGAEVLIINDTATLTINGGGLDVNCLDILVKSGGKLDLQSGAIVDKKVITVEGTGTFTNTSGMVLKCGRLQIIRDSNGKVIVIPL